MWLINIQTKLLEEFIGERIPPYAILSHTWEEGQEVLFQEMKDVSRFTKRGWKKIEETCRQAEEDKLKYAWVDTCCIDKSSSAELTEAINSMFVWYKWASKCYVYLSDLHDLTRKEDAWEEILKKCRWFKRGWTLQELIAPERIDFFDGDWNFCFTKRGAALQLSHVTDIDMGILLGKKRLFMVSVAQKMSWAAGRSTTRTEDMAYCLLGIFNVNMPMLYGEGQGAFERLQAEIVATSPDLSIFAWVDMPTEGVSSPEDLFSGVLAPSPRQFKGCGQVKKLEEQHFLEFTMTNRGIKVRTKFAMCASDDVADRGLVLPVGRFGEKCVGIRVRNCGGGCFARQNPTALSVVRKTDITHGLMFEPFLKTKVFPSTRFGGRTLRFRDFILPTRPHCLQIALGLGMKIYRRWPWARWDETDRLFFMSNASDPGWASVKIVTSLPKNIRQEIFSGSLGFIFHAFCWAKETELTRESESQPPRCTIFRVSGRTQDRMLEDQNDRAVTEGWESFWMANRLRYGRIPETSTITAPFTSSESSFFLSYDCEVVTDSTLCPYPFWRIRFYWKVLPNKEIPVTGDRSWRNMEWGEMFD